MQFTKIYFTPAYTLFIRNGIYLIKFWCTIHQTLPKISITRNKKQISLLNLLINCISARSTTEILSLNDEYTFLFLTFVIIGLCNSSATYSFCLIADSKENLFVIIALQPLADFLSKKL